MTADHGCYEELASQRWGTPPRAATATPKPSAPT